MMAALVDWHGVFGRSAPLGLPHEAAWEHAAELDVRCIRREGVTKAEARDAWRVAADACEEAGDLEARRQAMENVVRNGGVLGPGEHVHRCPSCYEAKPCAFTCTIESDQALDDGTPAGAIIECDDCAVPPISDHPKEP